VLLVTLLILPETRNWCKTDAKPFEVLLS